MSALEETESTASINLPLKTRAKETYLARFFKFLCSVRLGVFLLILLVVASFLGMIVMQQNVQGFDHYYAAMTPAQRYLYGKLGLFNIYHAWYFNALLAALSLNIILASIDRFPKTLAFIKPKPVVPLRWLRAQKQTASFVLQGEREAILEKIRDAAKKTGWQKVVFGEKESRTFVFAETGAWNRLCYLAIHAALLTTFLGGFLTAQLGFTGNIKLSPGQTVRQMTETVFDPDGIKESRQRLPFAVTCTDIEQQLINRNGALSPENTIDWLTHFTITDETGTREAFVQINRPFDYRGYRFFQADFSTAGRARNITVRVTPASGEIRDVTIPRNGAATLADGTQIKFTEFRGDFSLGREQPNEDTSAYPNPGAILQVILPDGTKQTAHAFGSQTAGIPVAQKPVAGYAFQLIDFERVSDRHTLIIQRDPGANVLYLGFAIMSLILAALFFFSHRRVWAAVEEISANCFQIVTGGNTNRNQTAFDEQFRRFTDMLRK